jgi:O-antigen/teichoic acid export membrane protein
MGVANTVLISLGKERRAALITTAAFAVVAASCWIGVPSAAFGEGQLRATAVASTCALTLAFLGAAVEVRRTAGGFIPTATGLRVGGALVVALAAGVYAPRFGRLLTPLVAAFVAAFYLAFLAVTRELGRADLASVRAILRRRK